MSWIEVRATFPSSGDRSPYIEAFRDHGIENTLEEGDDLVGAIVAVEGTPARLAELEAALRSAGATDVKTQPLPEVDWDEVWRLHFKPRRIGRRFIVRPTWETFDTGPEDIEIVLDPGQAFGTGDHATTRLCLELLESVDLKGKRLADVGCGSGILSIAAVKLGADVEAVDIEAISVDVTKENAARNGVEFRAIVGAGIASLMEPEPSEVGGSWEQDEHPLTAQVQPERNPVSSATYDVVVSNIISAVLIRISADVAAAIKPGGVWLVSGIIPANWPDVLAAAERAGFALEEKREEDNWVAARFTRA